MCASGDPLFAPPPRWTMAIAGSRLRVSAFFLVWLAIAVWFSTSAGISAFGTAVAFVAIVGSMLAHEGAHAVAAHRLGYDVQWVLLGGLAGMTAFVGRSDRPLERAAIALAGPAASAAVVAGFVLLGLMLPEGGAADLANVLAVFNGLGLVVNLLPVAGTDGARVVADLNAHARSRRRVDR